MCVGWGFVKKNVCGAFSSQDSNFEIFGFGKICVLLFVPDWKKKNVIYEEKIGLKEKKI